LIFKDNRNPKSDGGRIYFREITIRCRNGESYQFSLKHRAKVFDDTVIARFQ
jgi:hypothetical protein